MISDNEQRNAIIAITVICISKIITDIRKIIINTNKIITDIRKIIINTDKMVIDINKMIVDADTTIQIIEPKYWLK